MNKVIGEYYVIGDASKCVSSTHFETYVRNIMYVQREELFYFFKIGLLTPLLLHMSVMSTILTCFGQ